MLTNQLLANQILRLLVFIKRCEIEERVAELLSADHCKIAGISQLALYQIGNKWDFVLRGLFTGVAGNGCV